MIIKLNVEDIKMIIDINNSNNDINNEEDKNNKKIIMLEEYIDSLYKIQAIESNIKKISSENIIYYNSYDSTLLNTGNDNDSIIFENIIC